MLAPPTWGTFAYAGARSFDPFVMLFIIHFLWDCVKPYVTVVACSQTVAQSASNSSNPLSVRMWLYIL